MSESQDNESEMAIEVDPIEVIHQGECLSLSGRSTLTYAIGRHAEDGTLHLRITGNTSAGMFCSQWASASDIQDLVLGEAELTSRSLQPLWAGKSVNSFSFCLASLRDLGLVEVSPENTRWHRHQSGKTFEQVVMARIAQSLEQEAKPSRRKSKEG